MIRSEPALDRLTAPFALMRHMENSNQNREAA